MSKGDRKTTVLIVLDGWGYREDTRDNAIALGKRRFGIGSGSRRRIRLFPAPASMWVCPQARWATPRWAI